MKVLRFLFLTIHGTPRSADGLPTEEGQAFANAWLIPAQHALRDFVPEEAMAELIHAPSRAKASEVAIGLWSAQQSLCERLAAAGVDARGLPPVTGRALEGFFLPSGRFWAGAYCPTTSLAQSQDAVARALGSIFGQPPRKSRAIPFPWLNEFSRSAAWALGANQAFGDTVDLLGNSSRPAFLDMGDDPADLP